MFERPPFSGTPKPGLNFITDKQRTVLAAKDLSLNKKVVLRKFDSLTLDRLYQKRGLHSFYVRADQEPLDHPF